MNTTRRRVVAAALSAAPFTSTALLAPAAHAAATTAVTGTVTGPSGEFLAGVPVDAGGRTAVTDGQGRYRLTDLPPSTTSSVCARPPDDYRGGTARTGYLGSCVVVSLPASGTTTTDLRLPVGGAVSGRVVDARTGRGVPAARIELQGSSFAGLFPGPVTTTGSDGTWSVRGLDPQASPWWACLTGGTRPTVDAPFGYDATYSCVKPADVAAGAVTKGLSFQVRPLTSISGTVTRPAGSDPVALFDPASGINTRESTGGRYTLRPLAHFGAEPATGTVCARSELSWADPRGLALQCVDVPFKVTTAGHADFRMTVGGAIRGTATGATSTATVSVDRQGVRIQGLIRPDGTFAVGGLPSGTYTVHVTDNHGPNGQSKAVTVVAGRITDGVAVTLH